MCRSNSFSRIGAMQCHRQTLIDIAGLDKKTNSLEVKLAYKSEGNNLKGNLTRNNSSSAYWIHGS